MLVAGLLAGLGMMLVMLGLRLLGLSRLPMARYAGALVTGRTTGAGVVAAGLGAWLAVSLLFGFLYALAFSLLGWNDGSRLSAVILGAALGFVHGIIGGIALPGIDFFNRPVRSGDVPALGRFGANYGGGTALSLLTAHVAYGALFGWIYGLFEA